MQVDKPKHPDSLKNVKLLPTAPSTIKTVFAPSQWRQVVEFLREVLFQNKTIYVSFKYKPMGPKSTGVELCSGYVTKDNVKYLPRMLNRAWSDISLYDLMQEI